jgi:O-antigen ligase
LGVANHVGFALLDWSWLLALVVLATLMHHWPMHDRELLDKSILCIVLVGSLGYLWWFWRLNAFIYFEPAETGVARPITFPGFSNVRFFSDYQSFALLLLPTALQRLTNKGLVQILGTWTIGLFYALAFIAGSRSLIATHILLHALLWSLLRRGYADFLLLQLRFWLIGALYFLLLTWLVPLMIGQYGSTASLVVSDLARTESSRRTELWALAWQIIQAYPLFGVGPMHYADIPNQIAAHPHNLIMQFATEWGIPATLLITWLILDMVATRIKHLTASQFKTENEMPLVITCGGLALLIQSMVAGVLNYPVTQMIIILFFAYPLQRDNQIIQKTSQKLHMIGLFSIMMVIGSLTTLKSIQERNKCFYSNHWPTRHYAPRFWQQGWITGECGPGTSLTTVFKPISLTSSRPPAQTP